MSTLSQVHDEDFSLKHYFVPLTTVKAIHFLVIIGFLVYANALFNQFVWDDIPQIVNNTFYHSITNAPAILFDHTFTFYRPVAAIVMSGLFTLFGPTPFWFHLFQVSLHIFNTIVLFIIFKKFFGIKLSFFLSLIFLVHPIQVEAVSYISSLQINLSMAFGLSALLLSINNKIKLPIRTGLTAFLLLCSLLSKETGIIFLLLLIPFIKLFSSKTVSKNDYLFAGFAIGLSGLLYLLLRFGINTNAPIAANAYSPVPMMQATLAERLLSLPKIVFFYIQTLFFPMNLAISQNWMVRSADFQNFYLPLVFVSLFFLAITVPGFYFFSKRKKQLPLYLFFLVWFLVSWAIHWNIISLDMTVAERWFYVALAGLLGLLGVGIQSITVKNVPVQNYFLWTSIILITLFSMRTIYRNMDWSSPLVLYAHDLKISTDSYDLENSFASRLITEGRIDESYPHIKRSIELAPDYWENWGNLGVYYDRTGQVDKSIEAFTMAIKKNKYYHNGYINLATVYFYKKTPQAAKAYFTKALQAYPDDPQLLLLSAITDYKLGNKETAMQQIMKAYTKTHDPKLLTAYQEMQQNVEIK